MQVSGVKLSTAAEMMGVSEIEIHRLIRANTLRTYGSGTGLRVIVDSLRPFVHDSMIPVVPERPTKKRKSQPQGYIYLVKSGKYYKIGLTQDIPLRIQALNTIVPGGVQLIHTIPTNDMERAETFLHEQFKHRQVNGEWFILSKADVSSIQQTRSLFE